MNEKAKPSCKKSLEFRKSIMIKLFRGGRASRSNGIVSTLIVTGYEHRFGNLSTYVLTPQPHRTDRDPSKGDEGRTTKNTKEAQLKTTMNQQQSNTQPTAFVYVYDPTQTTTLLCFHHGIKFHSSSVVSGSASRV
jgi:hypothetical protein